MKGALLMLALLVTRELTFETHEVEACPVFYEMQIIVNFVLPRAALNETFDSVSATDEEKAAFGKIQDCFIEVGHQNRVNHLIFKGQVKFLQQLLLFASSPGDCRATVSAGSNPSNGDLWSTPPEFHLSQTS
ncbi:hypothetical protein MJT46_013336 [Ovis ammon polii x Ovis aries]|nr:hypothetical protein MJT46_013336 [Ovis ammon polii x Ovis aries]